MTSTPTVDDIVHTITGIAADVIGPGAEIEPDTDLRAVSGVDSVKVLRMIAKIEQTYDVELEDEDVFGVATVSGAAALVEKALREPA